MIAVNRGMSWGRIGSSKGVWMVSDEFCVLSGLCVVFVGYLVISD